MKYPPSGTRSTSSLVNLTRMQMWHLHSQGSRGVHIWRLSLLPRLAVGHEQSWTWLRRYREFVQLQFPVLVSTWPKAEGVGATRKIKLKANIFGQ